MTADTKPLFRLYPRPKSYLARMDEIPPNICRLIARTKSKYPHILTIPEIAAASGLTWQKVSRIAKLKSFGRVAVEDADKFRLGCGITPETEKMHKHYIRRNLSENQKGFKAINGAAVGNKSKFWKRVLKQL